MNLQLITCQVIFARLDSAQHEGFTGDRLL